jgi:hypothetical protein
MVMSIWLVSTGDPSPPSCASTVTEVTCPDRTPPTVVVVAGREDVPVKVPVPVPVPVPDPPVAFAAPDFAWAVEEEEVVVICLPAGHASADVAKGLLTLQRARRGGDVRCVCACECGCV